MRKNGSRLISFGQYRTTDLFLFAVIFVAFELLIRYAVSAFSSISFSSLVPVVVLVLIRWGWPAAFYAAGGGLLYCLLNLGSEGFLPSHYAVYIIGNLFICLLLLVNRYVGKKRIISKWYFSALYVLAAWLLAAFGRTIVAACFGFDFAATLVGQLSDLVTLGVAVVIILVMRRLDGMFEDQKAYLLRLDEERKAQAKRDTFGEDYDGYTEIDGEALSILNRNDDSEYL